ncbi:CoA-acylating methylmalonate-semialdehyde dehydrogenase [Microbacterium protaetiae]|uniref:methylmalonate-semialdehyde dehydrogenase (CoA acylating) n=1 Tax=Microbacterium protaetiae TaxID=2509458 RepID=A0A4P6EAN3_9MICO|nr:CoA-acylating methylmalonate-semialdehyde dehydrogenase [Microbacterium protaetiae]QAY59192.1 CoA-acylating methylmalonate-semialdehyde dehydrogenase [Microbacterium protaetiae]
MDNDIPVIPHWIAGTRTTGSGARTAPVFDPALGRPRAAVVLADDSDVQAAVASAGAASGAWGELSVARRQRVMFAFRELLNARKDELALLITHEHGKVVSDALGEISRGLEVVEFATGFAHLTKGEYSDNVSTGVDAFTFRQPLGVVGIISPFNFPAMVPLWFAPIALAAGNAVILKPSEKDPSAAVWIAELLQEAGLPDGVFTVLHGDKQAVDGLIDHPDVAAISFVGSTAIAKYVYQRGSAQGKRVQAFGGAKNHMLVLGDADLDTAADAAVSAAYGSAGERCMAVSVVLAVDEIADELVRRIDERASTLRVGDGRRDCDMGPLVTAQHRERVASYIDVAAHDGATVVRDGREVVVDGDEGGFWLGPTLIDRVPTSSTVYSDEIFGPVLSIVRVRDLAEGIELINASSYGNGTALFTADGGAARRFQRDAHVGMIGVNVPIPVPVAFHSFGGWKDSLFGDTKAYGPQSFQFFTREKAVTLRWPEHMTAGLSMGFPGND